MNQRADSEEGPSTFIEFHVAIVALCWHLQRVNEWVRVRSRKLDYYDAQALSTSRVIENVPAIQ